MHTVRFVFYCVVVISITECDVSSRSGCIGGSVRSFCPRKTISPPELITVTDVKDSNFDAVVVVTDTVKRLRGNLQSLMIPIENYAQIDISFDKQPVLIHTDVVPSGRLIFSCTGPLDRDYDDVRRFADAAKSGIRRALNAGSKRPLFVCPPGESFEKSGMVANLAVLETLYVPLELREAGIGPRVDGLGIWYNDTDDVAKSVSFLKALEAGRIVARDIGGSDPERMAPPKVEEYIHDAFTLSGIQINVISDVNLLQKEYPLLTAVNRAANTVDRHRARLLFMEYIGDGNISKTLFLVGKGITFDTGGTDIKAGGVMAGMHRDKSGASAVAGFMKVLSIVKPSNLRVVAGLPFVRNSVGEDSYVADEIIKSRAGIRVRVGNTDAEGRMVMADVLCQMKELALNAVNPHLFTVATLTGHAIRAVGPDYSIIMDNGPARLINTAQNIQSSGEKFGDPFEISTIRRDDYRFHKGRSEYEDVLQANNLPSTLTSRGHQSPAAFLIMASGLDKHGIKSTQPLPFSHVDIAGSSGPYPGIPTAAPIVALSAQFILQ